MNFLWVAVYLVWVASEVLILVVKRAHSDKANTSDRGSLIILWATSIVSIACGIWFGQAHRNTGLAERSWFPPALIGLLAAGLVVRWMAIIKLGKYFSVNVAVHESQLVETTGLFRFVRHPSYSGLLMIFTAIGLHTRSWVGLAIALIPITAALLYRIHVEEAALLQSFGQDYESYSRVTKRLIPGLY